MNLVKCNYGHFYDDERYSSCPHCAAPDAQDDNLTVPIMSNPSNDAITVAMNLTAAMGQPSQSEATSLADAVRDATHGNVNAPISNDDKTVGFYSSTIGKEPVVGWLVCTSGEHFGEDFKMKSGRNFIGRAGGMDIALLKDGTVSRERHAIVVYEPRENVFIVQPGDSKELSYLNGEVVLSPKEINPHDRLVVGKSELMFIPCCTSAFNWDMAKSDENTTKV